MTHTVIIGSGATGLLAAEGLAEVARDGEQITVVGEHPEFRAGAASPWVSAGETLQFGLAPALKRKGIGFRATGARRLHPDRNQIELGDAAVLDYDIALIASGPAAAFEEVPGLGPRGYTQSFCQPESAVASSAAWQRLLADPGPVVIGAVQGASCLVPAYESALYADAELRRHGVRDAAPITFITPEPHLGDLGIGRVDDPPARLEAVFASRGIAWIDRAVVERIDPDAVHVRRLDEQGACVARYALRFRYALILPAFRGIPAITGIDGLADERGFLIVDEHLRNPRYPNLYAAGVAVTSTAAPRSGPKAPYLIDEMVQAVLRNIRDQLDGREPSARPTWSAARFADLGAGGIRLIADPHPACEPHFGAGSNDWVQMPRCAMCDAGQSTRPAPLR